MKTRLVIGIALLLVSGCSDNRDTPSQENGSTGVTAPDDGTPSAHSQEVLKKVCEELKRIKKDLEQAEEDIQRMEEKGRMRKAEFERRKLFRLLENKELLSVSVDEMN